MMQAVDYIFTQCAATYGADWDRAIGKAPIADIKTAWLNALAPFRNSKKRIVWALQNLPDRCPNPIQFKNLCFQAPMPETPALPEPKADPERVQRELSKLGHIRAAEKPAHGMKAWAHRLQARDKAGEPINLNQRRCYRAALGIEA
jgi:hypothetical protein